MDYVNSFNAMKAERRGDFMGERLTWEEMVDKYPNKWVILDQVVMDGPDVESGVLIDVCEDTEINQVYVGYRKSGKKYIKERTTGKRQSGTNKSGR